MTAPTVTLIPISQIHVLNPRARNKVVFQGIVANIAALGLKKPITVAKREDVGDGKCYALVCGQGRLEAYLALGQTEIPAIVTEASREECFLMSLVENIARRHHTPTELLREISTLKARGYSTAAIAKKIDVAPSYINGIMQLLEKGEDRLLAGVERGRVPLSVAIEIAAADEVGIQRALCAAYEDKTLRGAKLHAVRRLIEQRKTDGKQRDRRKVLPLASADALIRVYRQETDRQQLLIKKAQLTENRLLFIVSALKRLLEDEGFVTLLRAEGLNTLPAYLAERINGNA
jgi:ParB family chromosome partitioning protein